MRLGRGFTAVARQVPRLAGLAGCAGAVSLHPGLRAIGAQGTRETCCLAGVLPPLGDGPRGSRVWQTSQGQCPLTPDCPPKAGRGHNGTCGLAGVLPPWHDRCHGSRVWQAALRFGVKAIPKQQDAGLKIMKTPKEKIQNIPHTDTERKEKP